MRSPNLATRFQHHGALCRAVLFVAGAPGTTLLSATLGESILAASCGESVRFAVIAGVVERPTLTQLAPATLAVGSYAPYIVTLDAIAATETIVTLTSSRPEALRTPTTLTIPAGSTQSVAAYIMGVVSTGTATVRLTATWDGLSAAPVEVKVTPP